jgi:hypothetical protein
VSDHTPVFDDIPPTAVSEDFSPEPELLLDRRLVRKGAATVPQVLIKWKGLPHEMSSWEEYYILKNRFSSSSIWGPVGSTGGGDVTTGN